MTPIGSPTLRNLAVSAAVALTLILWLIDIGGPGIPHWSARTAVVLALLGLSWTVAAAWRTRVRRVGSGVETWLLPVLFGLALIVRFNGLGWEAGEGNYRDEGIYLATARRIHGGQTLQFSFIYGHLLFYLSAFVLWLQDLFPQATAWMASKLGGATDAEQQTWVLLRSVNALFGALTTLPVYGAARRLAGTAAAATAGLLIVCSPLYDEISKLLISDLPSAFFATLCLYFAARLLESESSRDYLLAGVSAGLAAGSKYPAGLVAAAIVAVWAKHRLADRRWNWGLPLATMAAIVSFLVAIPSLLVAGSDAFTGGGRDIFFGVRQYGGGGWIGVMRESNTLFYGSVTVESFGWLAVVAGSLGLVVMSPERRRALLWFLAFPLSYAILIAAMSMAVRRNLLPIVPALAVVLGIGLTAWLDPLRRWSPWGPRLAGALIAIAAAAPMIRTVENQLALTRPGTRQLTLEWIEENVPPGARFVQESYTPKLDPLRWPSSQGRFAARRTLDELSDPDNDYILLAWNAYGRFTKPENLTQPHHQTMARRYQTVLSWDRVADFRAGRIRKGPWLSIFSVPLDPAALLPGAELKAQSAAFLHDVSQEQRRLVWGDDGWALFKVPLEPGAYEVEIQPPQKAGTIRLVDRTNRTASRIDLEDSRRRFDWPEGGKVFLYLDLPKGARVTSVKISKR